MSTSVQWRDVVLDGSGSGPYRLTALTGWEALPPARFDRTPRANAHGSFAGPVWSDERLVTVEGYCWAAADRDSLLADLQASMAYGGPPNGEPLTVTSAGRTLTAAGQLVAAEPALLRGQWGVGRFGWLAQWRCPDPLRYGPEVSLSTGYPTAGGGLTYPLEYALDYGAEGDPGRVFLENPGTALAPVRLRVDGPVDVAGFEVAAVELGRRLRYEGEPVLADQWLDLDLSTGTVRLNGTSDRRANLTVAEWFTVPARGGVSVQFAALGAPDPAALLTAATAAAYW